MSALLDSLAAGFDGDASRRAALDDALRDGLPRARSEAWKYTSLRALERRTFAPVMAATATVDAALLRDIPAPRLRCLVQNSRTAASRRWSRMPLWSLVSHVFAVGSHSSFEICRIAELEPEEFVVPKRARSSTRSNIK